MGWDTGSGPFTKMVHDANRRKTFIASVIQLIQKYGFDGLSKIV